MLIIASIMMILSITLIGYSIWCLFQAKRITTAKQQEETEYKAEILKLKESIDDLSKVRINLLDDISDTMANIDAEYEKERTRINEQIELYKNNTSYAGEQYFACLEKEYEKAEREYDAKIQKIESEKQQVEVSLKNLQDALSAGVRAQLREKEKEDKIDFYKIVISENDVTDIQMLNQFKLTFHSPSIINKLIWTTYFQKRVTEMCNRVLGTGTVCGIYKITNLKTKECYIGQSVNISERWKQHCKCGCDIDASATNKLYQDMIKTGIWNFSFELMEECPRASLNEKERFWIKLYQSDIYGLNSTKGNK